MSETVFGSGTENYAKTDHRSILGSAKGSKIPTRTGPSLQSHGTGIYDLGGHKYQGLDWGTWLSTVFEVINLHY
jgi:hypothetical protein